MDLGLQDKRAIVFGSTSGLGRCIAETLAAEGALVAITGRREHVAAEVASSLCGAVAITGDIIQPGEASRVVEEAALSLGGLDICVVNTGGGRPGGMLDVTAEDEATAYESMLRPALAIGRAAVPHLRDGGNGRLIYITARSIIETSPELALSSVYRSGVAAAARSLSVELAPDVLVNVVVPGQFDTPALGRFQAAQAANEGTTIEGLRADHLETIPIGRFGRAQELADLVAFLSSENASFITGSIIRIDGGAVRGF